ncbi:MAG: ArgE/DapE family deacylase [bacterium]
MERLEHDILKAVDENSQEIIRFLQDILRIPSVTGEEKQIQDYISKKLEGLNMELDIWEPEIEKLKGHPAFVPVEASYKNRPNVVGKIKGTGKGKSLLFNGHVDVIPVGRREAWTVDPWGGEIIDDYIYGRGASDMKSGIAAMTAVAMIMNKLGLKPLGDMIFEYTVDEELSGNGTLACVLRGYKADVGISLETSSMKIQPASIGRIWFEIDIKGKPAGIQDRRNGVNAIDLGYKIKQAVEAYEAYRISTLSHPLYKDKVEALPCIIGEFTAGNYPSSFPDSCKLRGSIATLPGEDSERVKDSFKKYILEAAAQDSWMRNLPPQLDYKGYFAEPSEMNLNHSFLPVIVSAYNEVLNRSPEISGRAGAADIRFLNKYGETPSLIFGPGDTKQMHATDERVKIKDVIDSVKVLMLAVYRWVGLTKG